MNRDSEKLREEQQLRNERQLINKLQFINDYGSKLNIMEVCGTHTVAISKFGFRGVLSENINLISGPGCPVCVTPSIYIDYIYNLSLNKDVIIATYGDMIRVPGSCAEISLEKARAKGAEIRIVYSSMDALKLAMDNKDKKVVFLGIGFETTAPATAIAVKEAYNLRLNNFYVFSMHKIMEPVMRVLLEDESLKIDAFLCPGHVATVLGKKGFGFLEEYNCLGVIAGFSEEDIINGLYDIVESFKNKDFTVKNSYKRVVENEGNKTSRDIISEIFDVRDDYWRGLGIINGSGLRLKETYNGFDIEKLYPFTLEDKNSSNGCQCGEVLKGKIKPTECRLFGTVCSPENPIGPCMVSAEGGCAAYYKYNF